MNGHHEFAAVLAMPSKKKKREVAVLVARASNGTEVERLELSLEEYYEGLHKLIDSGGYRADRGIAFIEGTLYDPSGEILQEFRNRYGRDGKYLGGRAVHADGTVNED
jgi:hypothetical protein